MSARPAPIKSATTLDDTGVDWRFAPKSRLRVLCVSSASSAVKRLYFFSIAASKSRTAQPGGGRDKKSLT